MDLLTRRGLSVHCHVRLRSQTIRLLPQRPERRTQLPLAAAVERSEGGMATALLLAAMLLGGAAAARDSGTAFTLVTFQAPKALVDIWSVHIEAADATKVYNTETTLTAGTKVRRLTNPAPPPHTNVVASAASAARFQFGDNRWLHVWRRRMRFPLWSTALPVGQVKPALGGRPARRVGT